MESSSAVLVMILSKSVSTWNHSRVKLVDSSRMRAFWRRFPHLMHSYGGLLEPRGSELTLLKSTFNAKNLHVLAWTRWDLCWSVCCRYDAEFVGEIIFKVCQQRCRYSDDMTCGHPPPSCTYSPAALHFSLTLTLTFGLLNWKFPALGEFHLNLSLIFLRFY